jgi:hypothetical protein
MNSITIIDHVLTAAECQQMIDLWHSDSAAVSDHLLWNQTLAKDLDPNAAEVRELASRILSVVQQQYPGVVWDWGQIVKWPTGSRQLFHYDTASTETTVTSVLYLNDDFSGGFTQFFDDVKIPAKQGRMIVFEGRDRLHGVAEVTAGIRWSLPVWYKATVVK